MVSSVDHHATYVVKYKHVVNNVTKMSVKNVKTTDTATIFMKFRRFCDDWSVISRSLAIGYESIAFRDCNTTEKE